MAKENEIVLFETEDAKVRLTVPIQEDTVWLTQAQMTELFDTSKQNVSLHINNCFKEGELDKGSVVKDFLTTASDGKNYKTKYYNLDVIISVGYRVKSIVGTRFRQWATERLAEYIIKGFTMDDERLKNLGGGGYWKELLDRIRDIRSSEKVMYRQVLDLYATSVDYDPRTDASKLFFKMVQNILHYAAHGHTAAEVIYDRADADKPFMGLTSFKGELPCINDIKIAKNYLTAEELKILNNIVSGYFDFAETQALRHRPMYMEDYVRQLDNILSANGDELLEGAGSVSHEEAMNKALIEYRKFQVKTLSPVEQDYLESIKLIEKKTKKKGSKGGM